MRYKTLPILFCLFLMGRNEVKCQRAIEISYKPSLLDYTDSIGKKYQRSEATFKLRMIFNDSFALVYFYSDTDNRRIKGKQVGHKLMHHGTFYDHITGEKFSEVSWSKKEKYLIKDTIPAWNWQYLNEERTILNKKCFAALHINAKHDSILVWYCKDMAFKKAALWYDSLPGVVLEVYDQVKDQHYIAVKINERDIKMVPPQEGIKISMADFVKQRDAWLLKKDN